MRDGHVSEIPAEQLLKRAIENGAKRTYYRKKQPRWVQVMNLFGLGSTYAWQLCLLHDLDPEEIV